MVEWISSNGAFINLIVAVLVMASTVVYAILTASLVRETKRMRRAQTDPEIAVYLEHDEQMIGVLHLIIRNVGSGPAYDLRFELKDVRLQDWASDSIHRLALWERGLPYLAPGAYVKTVAGAAFQDGARDFTLTVTVSYAGADKVRRTETFAVDYVNHVGTTQLRGEAPLKEIAKELAAIRRIMERGTDDDRTL